MGPPDASACAFTMPFRVELQQYFGPLDLLLHLVRKQELEAAELPLADLTEQYLQHVAVLESIDVDTIGDFLDVASTLIEIKSRLVLPQHETNGVDGPPPEDLGPSPDLVRRLLEYKRFRDVSAKLERQRGEWRRQFARESDDRAGPKRNAADEPIHGVELWDLVGAFVRVMRDRIEPPEPEAVPYDDTPMDVMVGRVHAALPVDGPTPFEELFPERVLKSVLVGTFLAVLELIRRGHVALEQDGLFGRITLRRTDKPLVAGDELDVGERTDAA